MLGDHEIYFETEGREVMGRKRGLEEVRGCEVLKS